MSENGNTSKDVVRKLIHYVRENKLTVGERLPPIPQLSDMWGVGRNVVRDGLLQAQNLGLVRIHPRLGTFVQAPDFSPLVEAVAETLDLTLLMDDRNLMHLIEARYMAERETVVAAASRRQPEDLFAIHEILKELQDSVGDRARFVQADERFHVAIAMASGNPVMAALVRALLVALRPYRMSILVTEEEVQNTMRVHQELYRCLVEAQGDRARELMDSHSLRGREQILDRLGLTDESKGSRQEKA
jgi:GntR family transcriptional repressor for pyruvate dehydrogenase complex